jgi:hypothetical protein
MPLSIFYGAVIGPKPLYPQCPNHPCIYDGNRKSSVLKILMTPTAPVGEELPYEQSHAANRGPPKTSTANSGTELDVTAQWAAVANDQPLYTLNLCTVVDSYFSPGFRIVVGKCGWFGESG